MTSDSSGFADGVLRPELYMGVVSAIGAVQARVNLSFAGAPSGSHFEARRYGRGEVGEFVLIEGQRNLVLGRIVEVRLPEAERRALEPENAAKIITDVVGTIQFLGTVRSDSLQVSPGVEAYPRLGDRVYAAPHRFVSRIPELMESATRSALPVSLEVGRVGGPDGGWVAVRPERLFGRHCAVLGATGGGKSWTVATLIEQCLRYQAKVVLLDATGEYRSLRSPSVRHLRLGPALSAEDPADECSLHADCFLESDFVALFEPSGKVQGPKLREAMITMRVLRAAPDLATNGYFVKARRPMRPFLEKQKELAEKGSLEDPSSPFDVQMLGRQVLEECVWPELTGTTNGPRSWGGYDDGAKSYCLPLVARILSIVSADAFAPVFRSAAPSLVEELKDYLAAPSLRLLRISLSGVSYEYRAREVMANAIGRMLLSRAREGALDRPLVVFVDEAHNFLGQEFGREEMATRLDSFELIAREGRKYGVNLCLSTQRPRDLTEAVLSQMGTLVVHRLTNDRDRDVVERACGEIDRTASAFLPNLKPGEAAIIGVDFPIPMTVQIEPPASPPRSDGPDYQSAWAVGTQDRERGEAGHNGGGR